MHSRIERLLGSIFIALPVGCLALAALSWLRHGIDFPLWDDWRDYQFGNAGSLDLKFLFTPANDTLFPVGRLLDSLAFRFLDGNTIAYQFVSMVCIQGSLLLLQWKLLVLALGDRSRAAVAFALTIFMVQPDSYWGWQNLAYHHAIALVCLLSALLLVLQDNWKGRIGAPLLCALGLVAGFSYISGAFATLVAGMVLLAVSPAIARPERAQLWQGGMALSLAGLITTAAQLWVIIVVQQGTHRADAPMALPTEADFWLYMLGKIGRALMLPTGRPAMSLALTIVFVAATGLLALYALRQLAGRGPVRLTDARALIVFSSLLAVVMVYLALVSAGRANLRPATETGALQVFSFGFLRFHFFWVTLLLPWSAALAVVAARAQSGGRQAPAITWLALLLALVPVAHAVRSGVWRHAQFFRYTTALRVDAIRCVSFARQTGKDVPCPRADLAVPRAALEEGLRKGASFSHAVALALVPLGGSPPPLFRMTPPDWLRSTREDIEIISSTDQRVELESGSDPKVLFTTSLPGALARCREIDVAVRMRVAQDDRARLFFLPQGQEDFSEASSSVHEILATPDFREIHLSASSPSGFGNRFRLDPVEGPQHFALDALELRCLESGNLEEAAPAGSTGGRLTVRPSAPLAANPLPLALSEAHLTAALRLRKISILFGTYVRRNPSTADLRLKRAGGAVFTTRFDLGDLQDNAYRAFTVDPGQYVSAEIVPVTGGGVSVWESVDTAGTSAPCIVYEYTNGNVRYTQGCPAN